MVKMTNPQSARETAQELITHLQGQRDTLQKAIDALVEVYGKREEKETVEATKNPPPPRTPANTFDATKPPQPLVVRVGRNPIGPDTSEGRTKGTLTETVLAIATKHTLTSIELTNLVEGQMDVDGKQATRQAIQTSISTLLREGKLHKGNDLLIRRVVGGVIQNLPPMPPGPFTSFADGRSSE